MEPALADLSVPDRDPDLDRRADRASAPIAGVRLSRITTAEWVGVLTAYSYLMTSTSAAWFLRREVEARGGQLGVAESLLWQGAVYGLWLPVCLLVWQMLNRFGAGARTMSVMTLAGLVIVPLQALAATGLDTAFGAGTSSEIFERTIGRAPVAILLYTAICAVGMAAAHRSRAVAARTYAKALERALALARQAATEADAPAERLMVMIGNRRAPVLLEDVEWFAAAGNYVVVHWADREGLIREPLKSLEARLDERVFARSHRSTVVNLARVRDTQSLSDGSWRLTMTSGAELTASRPYRAAVLARLGRLGAGYS
ncbi:MAG: LytTR family DNA-binding domain-containing protein [Brevundimonas sp.]